MATTAAEKSELKEAVEESFQATQGNGRTVREMIRDERNGWYERHRGAVIDVEYTIHHPLVEKILRRDYDKMSEWMYFIPVFGKVLVEKLDDVLAIESHVKNSILKHTNAINNLIKQANVVYMQSSIPAPDKFNAGRKQAIKLTSPLGRIYLEMLLQADMFLMLMNDLWIRGLLHEEYELNESKRNEYELEVKRMINTVNMTILRQHRAILNRLRRQAREDSAPETGKTPAAKPQAKAKAAKTEEVAAAA